MEHYIVEKRHCTLCFWTFERRKLKSQSKTNAEVTPTDVYIMRSRSVPRANSMPSRTLLGALYIYRLRVSNLFVLLRRHFLRPKCRNGQKEIPSFFSGM